MYLPRNQPSSLWAEWAFWKKKKKRKVGLKHARHWRCERQTTLFLEKRVVTTCVGDANLCLPYQHVRHKGRLIIHEVSGWPRRVNHSSACVFVTIEIDAPETYGFIFADSADGGTMGAWFQQHQTTAANVWHDIPLCALIRGAPVVIF